MRPPKYVRRLWCQSSHTRAPPARRTLRTMQLLSSRRMPRRKISPSITLSLLQTVTSPLDADCFWSVVIFGAAEPQQIDRFSPHITSHHLISPHLTIFTPATRMKFVSKSRPTTAAGRPLVLLSPRSQTPVPPSSSRALRARSRLILRPRPSQSPHALMASSMATNRSWTAVDRARRVTPVSCRRLLIVLLDKAALVVRVSARTILAALWGNFAKMTAGARTSTTAWVPRAATKASAPTSVQAHSRATVAALATQVQRVRPTLMSV